MKTGERSRRRPRQRRMRRRQRCCRRRVFSGGEEAEQTGRGQGYYGVWGREGGGWRSWSRTLQPADVRPLLLLHHGALQLGTEGHMIHVVQQDANHLTGEVLQPGDRDHFTELQRWRETPASASVSPWKRPISQRQIFLSCSGCITAKILGMILL